VLDEGEITMSTRQIAEVKSLLLDVEDSPTAASDK
jgi:hypothetical protein